MSSSFSQAKSIIQNALTDITTNPNSSSTPNSRSASPGSSSRKNDCSNSNGKERKKRSGQKVSKGGALYTTLDSALPATASMAEEEDDYYNNNVNDDDDSISDQGSFGSTSELLLTSQGTTSVKPNPKNLNIDINSPSSSSYFNQQNNSFLNKVPHIPSLHNTKLSPSRLDHEYYARDSLLPLASPAIADEPAFQPVYPMSSSEFLKVIDSVREAIQCGVFPTRITQGSSGSYFCRNKDGEIVGVFKPKNEEPYGNLNPKWTKWIHKNLFPCCFGRSCLIPNLGYVSEAAASFVDRKLELFICPRTEVVTLASPTFYYPAKDRYAFGSGAALPEKIGSFQIFLKGFKDATTFFKEGYDRVLKSTSRHSDVSYQGSQIWNYWNGGGGLGLSTGLAEDWDEETQNQFRWGFERLVILDYLIRNTDRGSDNWMILYNPPPLPSFAEGLEFSDQQHIQKEKDEQRQRLISVQEDSMSAHTYNPSSAASNANNINKFSNGTSRENHGKSTDLVKENDDGNEEYLGGDKDITNAVILNMDIPNSPSKQPLSPTLSSDAYYASFGRHNNHKSTSSEYGMRMKIHVAAIDNGLAFPYKHPDQWRSYPYGWAFLPCARVPFSAETRNQVLHLLTSQEWWHELFTGLERLFKLDPDFNESMWKKQKAVMRGQGYNLVEVLRRSETGDNIRGSPWALVQRPSVAVFEEDDYNDGFVNRSKRNFRQIKQRFETFTRNQPCFSWC